MVDLDGAFDGRPKNLSLVEQIVKHTKIPIQFGGGLRTTQDVKMVLGLGVNRVIIGTRAIDSPTWVAELCSTFPKRIAVGIDVKNGKVAVKGWTSVCDWTAPAFAKEMEKVSPCAIIYTDISKDGMLQGPNIPGLKELVAAVKTPIIASGGVSSLEDIKALCQLPIAGMIVGKALYTGHVNLSEVNQFLPAAEVAAGIKPSLSSTTCRSTLDCYYTGDVGLFVWDKSLEIGNDEIDNQHKRVI